MSKPRIFISSTYYDLKHLRASFDIFIDSLGFESIMFEKGDIPYAPDQALDISCYQEVQNADIFVLIIGGRYGSQASNDEEKPSTKSYERYNSVTKKEYEKASSKNIPTYIFIENNVYAEYYTYKKNKKKDVDYAHVDSENVFHLIDDIISKPLNNPIHTFEKFSDIESWLKEQWAGLFKLYLNRSTDQQQLATLSSKVAELGEVNKTLRHYLEFVMKDVDKEKSKKLIENEEVRLKKAKIKEEFEKNFWSHFLLAGENDLDKLIESVSSATSFNNFALLSGERMQDSFIENEVRNKLNSHVNYRTELNRLRKVLGLPTFRTMTKE